ncbi:Hypp1882 [Branchiostoma lanceolatum]|uniref:Hypp1882 protein n=1 Tax=Branchiostoma lanceolatum TaxID=7740 RepID=A0A8J9ZPA9_BRALA|nr:Hypp1882 [Branchiostoma lanceolatum]
MVARFYLCCWRIVNQVPKELSDLETLSLKSIEKCHERHLERLGKGLHKLLTHGQMCQRAKLTFDPDGNVGDEKDGKAVEPTDTVPFDG